MDKDIKISYFYATFLRFFCNKIRCLKGYIPSEARQVNDVCFKN